MKQIQNMEAYDELKQLAPDVFTVDSDWEGMTFRRRMTIIRLKTGKLLVHSPVNLRDETFARLDALGSVAYIVAPNAFHSSEAHYYKVRYPRAQLLASRACAADIEKRAKVDGLLPEAWPRNIEVECLEFQGTRMLAENVFFHQPSQTLILTDLVFHMQHESNAFERCFFKLNRIYRRFGPSNIFRYFLVEDRARAEESFHAIMKWDFDRVIMSHGVIVEAGGRDRMRQGFEEMGIR